MEVDRREKSVEQSTNAILNPSARSENTFFVNCPVSVFKFPYTVKKYVKCNPPVFQFQLTVKNPYKNILLGPPVLSSSSAQ